MMSTTLQQLCEKHLIPWAEQYLPTPFTQTQIDLFSGYLQILEEWNQKMNLTATVDQEEMVHRHLIDSLSVLKAMDIPQGVRLADIGTGAGLPGIPLKIARPDLDISLVEATGKKCIFLKEALKVLNLGSGIEIQSKRVEILGKTQGYRERYQIVVSRALAKLPVAIEYCLPLLRKEGCYIVLLGRDGEEQLKRAALAIKQLGGQQKHWVDLSEITGHSDRYALVVEKIRKTPPQYPRNPGLASTNPIISDS